jgi:hypothetical protein
MTDNIETGQAIELMGKSGERYTGRIYTDKQSTSSLTGKAISCLSNSSLTDSGWSHQVNAIYNTDRASDEIEQFKNRDDISHLILIPYSSNESGVVDKVDDLIRNYIHR